MLISTFHQKKVLSENVSPACRSKRFGYRGRFGLRNAGDFRSGSQDAVSSSRLSVAVQSG